MDSILGKCYTNAKLAEFDHSTAVMAKNTCILRKHSLKYLKAKDHEICILD